MPNDDLMNAFSALSDDAGHARLAPAATLRKRADRQTLARSVSGIAAAVVLVSGVVVGSRIVLADNALPPLPPGQSSAPTTAPPSVSPSPSVSVPSSPPSSADGTSGSTTSTSGNPTIPKSIPDRAFLRSSDLNDGKPERLIDDALVPLTLCGPSVFDSEELVGVRDGIKANYEEGRPDYIPLARVTDMVTIYRGDGAEKLLDETRAELGNCGGGEGTTYRSLGSLGLGDESILVRGSQPARGDDGELSPNGGTKDEYVARVRVGDTVVEVHVVGWESQTVKRSFAEPLIRDAVDRLKAWRS